MIAESAYRKLIQTQRDIRDTSDDLYLSHKDWYIKVCSNLGQLSTAINNNHPPHILLVDILNLAEVTQAWLQAYAPSNLFNNIRNELKTQLQTSSNQNHSRMRWFLLISQKTGVLAQVIETKKPTIELFSNAIQLSAILQIWTSSHDWFYEHKTPHETKCKLCSKVFKTEEGEHFKCPNCETFYDSYGNIITDDTQSPISTNCQQCNTTFETAKGDTIKCPYCKTYYDTFGNMLKWIILR